MTQIAVGRVRWRDCRYPGRTLRRQSRSKLNMVAPFYDGYIYSEPHLILQIATQSLYFSYLGPSGRVTRNSRATGSRMSRMEFSHELIRIVALCTCNFRF